MLTNEQVPGILSTVNRRLKEAAAEADLHVTGHNLEDEWLYVVVTPAKPGVRASDHARVMSQIERELREEGNDNVLLVPTMDD